mmetsp:Transcript_44215/g.32202  ORF Transcript_44215/g.32202 Transcript_44215/m.32202 type:complete len:190 (-) Transcript_44215:69-638(-)
MSVRETFEHTFNHSWEDCAIASWKKWPNPRRPDVLCVDIINKEFDEATGVLKATRLMMLKSWVPSWMPLAGNNVCFFLEESITDPKNKRLILKGKNLTFQNLAEMEETCIYTEDENGTFFEQEGAVTAYTFGLARRMEKFCLDRFRNAAIQGRDIMEQTIRRIKEEGFPMGITMNLEKPPMLTSPHMRT